MEAAIEGAKAVKEVAKTAGKGIDATREAGGFFAQILGGSLEEVGGILEDKLKYIRWKGRMRIVQRYNEMRVELGYSGAIKPMPPKLALPLLEAATLEDDDTLQDKWAALLVNATSSESHVELNRSYIDILERLKPFEACILDTIYSLPYEEMHSGGAATANLPERTFVTEVDGKTLELQEPSEKIKLALANLVTLNCIRLPTTWGGGEVYTSVNPTLMGKSFVDACRLEKNVT